MSQGSLILPVTGVLSGLALVQDINAALANLSGWASGATDPSTLTGGVQAFSFWADTSVSPNILRFRNASNSAWVAIGDLTQTNLALASQIGFQQDLYSSASAGGTSDALTASFSPGITNSTLASGVTTLTVRATSSNTTTTPTFTPNSGVVTPSIIVKGAGVPLTIGDIAGAAHWITLQWDITLSKWVLLNPANGVVSTSKVGEPFYWPSGAVLPSYGILCNGASGISSTTYSALFNVLVKSLSGATISIASPAVVSWTAHGLYVNAPVKFNTTGALPTGLTVGTTYYVISAGFGANSFQVSATVGGAAINTSGTQSGVHTAIHAPYGCANDLSTFSVPNVPAGYTLVQSNANEGTTTLGQLLDHGHQLALRFDMVAGGGSQAAMGSGGGGGGTGGMSPAGGAANLAAAANMRVYIRFA